MMRGSFIPTLHPPQPPPPSTPSTEAPVSKKTTQITWPNGRSEVTTVLSYASGRIDRIVERTEPDGSKVVTETKGIPPTPSRQLEKRQIRKFSLPSPQWPAAETDEASAYQSALPTDPPPTPLEQPGDAPRVPVGPGTSSHSPPSMKYQLSQLSSLNQADPSSDQSQSSILPVNVLPKILLPAVRSEVPPEVSNGDLVEISTRVSPIDVSVNGSNPNIPPTGGPPLSSLPPRPGMGMNMDTTGSGGVAKVRPNRPSPARLTMNPPNMVAHDLFYEVRRRVNRNLSRSAKCQKICCVSINGVILAFGLMIFFVSVFKTGPEIAPVILFIFVIAPGLALVFWLVEKWQHLAPDMIHEEIVKILDARVLDVLLGQNGLLAAMEPRPGDYRDELVTDLLTSSGLRQMQKGGYASVPCWATYHRAWQTLLDTIEQRDPALSQICRQVHAKWVDILQKTAGAAETFTTAQDEQKIRAFRRSARQGLSFAGDQIGNLAGAASDIGGMFGAMKEAKELKDTLEQIGRDLKDTRDAFKAQGLEADWEDRRSEHEMHPIIKRWLWFMLPFTALIFFLPSLSFGLLGVPAGAWAMAGIGIFIIILCSWMKMRGNKSLNLLECISDCEAALRMLLDKIYHSSVTAAIAEPSEAALAKAVSDLRCVLMENYYAALAIHLQADALLFRPFPYPGGEPPMLVVREGGEKDEERTSLVRHSTNTKDRNTDDIVEETSDDVNISPHPREGHVLEESILRANASV